MKEVVSATKRIIAILAVFAMVASACGSSDSDDASDSESDPASASTDGGECEGDVIKAAFVYIGIIGEPGWSKKHDDGRLAVEEEFGACVETTFLETVPEGADAEAAFERLARDGNDVIFGTSFGYMEPMLTVAEKFPDVKFEHATGFKVSENMGTYFGAAEEARYLSGMSAGAMSESGQVGYVAAFPIPEVLRGINAFTLGVQRVNPEATVEVVWTSTWFDPTVEKEAAESLINGGADVIAQHQDTASAGEAAEAAGGFWVGYHDDMSDFAPEAWLTAPIWDWGPFYTSVIQDIQDDKWESDQYYGNMADGVVTLGPVSDVVPQEVRDDIEAVQAEIIAGDFAPFDGPVNNQDGEEVVAEGETPDLGTLLGMEYLVEGVIGSATG